MKKKLFMLLMAMSLVMTACGGSVEEAEAEVEEAVEDAEEALEAAEEALAEAEEAVEETEEAAEEVTEETEAEAEETEAEVAEVDEETEAADETEGFVKGVMTEDGWESEWLGIRYTTPAGITMTSEEDLNEMMGLGQELLSEDFNDLQLKYAELNTVYEMMCISEDQVTNAMVTIEKLPIQMDIDTYIEAFKKTLSQVTTMTYSVVSTDEIITIGDREFTRVECIADYSGVQICQDYCLAIVDDRAVSVTVTYVDEDAAENVLSGFTAY